MKGKGKQNVNVYIVKRNRPQNSRSMVNSKKNFGISNEDRRMSYKSSVNDNSSLGLQNGGRQAIRFNSMADEEDNLIRGNTKRPRGSVENPEGNALDRLSMGPGPVELAFGTQRSNDSDKVYGDADMDFDLEKNNESEVKEVDKTVGFV